MTIMEFYNGSTLKLIPSSDNEDIKPEYGLLESISVHDELPDLKTIKREHNNIIDFGQKPDSVVVEKEIEENEELTPNPKTEISDFISLSDINISSTITSNENEIDIKPYISNSTGDIPISQSNFNAELKNTQVHFLSSGISGTIYQSDVDISKSSENKTEETCDDVKPCVSDSAIVSWSDYGRRAFERSSSVPLHCVDNILSLNDTFGLTKSQQNIPSSMSQTQTTGNKDVWIKREADCDSLNYPLDDENGGSFLPLSIVDCLVAGNAHLENDIAAAGETSSTDSFFINKVISASDNNITENRFISVSNKDKARSVMVREKLGNKQDQIQEISSRKCIPSEDQHDKKNVTTNKGGSAHRTNHRKKEKSGIHLDSNCFISGQRGSYMCWLCFRTFKFCFNVKKHILHKHPCKALCSIFYEYDVKIDGPHAPSQLLLFCPKKCKYATSNLKAFPVHLTKCHEPLLSTEGWNLFEIQSNFLSDEFCRLKEMLTVKVIAKRIQIHMPDTIMRKKMGHGHNSHKTSVSDNDFVQNHSEVSPAQALSGQSQQSGHISRIADQAEEQEEKSKSLILNDVFPCQQCCTTLATKTLLGTRTDVKPFECEMCGKSFVSRSKLKVHMRIHSGERTFECKKCDLRFARSFFLYRHMRTHWGESFKCKMCGKSFIQGADLQELITTCTGEKTFECIECDVKFTNSHSQYRHMRMHSGKKTFSCDICGNSFTDRSRLRLHMRTHTGEKPFECKKCSRRFAKSCNLYSHIKTHSGEKRFECMECEKRFTTKSGRDKHMLQHVEEKAFEWKECGTNYSQNIRLQAKKSRLQEKLKQLTCNECGKGFSERRNLESHLRTHKGEKPFLCDKCGKRFASEGYLKMHHRRMHRRKTHNEKEFKCVECGKRFPVRNRLQRHMTTHTGDKPFGCKECGKKYFYNCFLQKHMRKHTGEQCA